MHKAVDHNLTEKLSFKFSREDEEDDFEETRHILEVKSKYITIIGTIHLVRTQSGGEGGGCTNAYVCVLGGGGREHMFVRMQEKKFNSHKNEKTTEL